MIHKKPGSLLLELLFAMLISGIAISMGMNFPLTLVRFWQKISVISNKDIDLCKVNKLLEDDFSTIFDPQRYSDKPKFDFNVSGSDVSLTPSQGLASNSSNQPSVVSKDEEKKVFINIVPKDGIFDYIFFTSTNTLEIYSKGQPRILGIIYRLEKQPQRQAEDSDVKQLFCLSRYQTDEILKNPKDEIDFLKLSDKKITILSDLEFFSLTISAEIKEQSVAQDKTAKTDPKKELKTLIFSSSLGSVVSDDNNYLKKTDSEHAKTPFFVYSKVDGQQNSLPYKIVLDFKSSKAGGIPSFSKEIMAFASYQF